MAKDNLSYQELQDHDKLMKSMRSVMLQASKTFVKYNPEQITDHNESSQAHADIRSAINQARTDSETGDAEIRNSMGNYEDTLDRKIANITQTVNSIRSTSNQQINNISNMGARVAVLESNVDDLNNYAQDSGALPGTYGSTNDVVASSGTSFSVPKITVDAKGKVTSISNTTVSIPRDDSTNNPGTVNQKSNNINVTYPVLLAGTANATTDLGPQETWFAKNVKVNPSKGEIIANTFTGDLNGTATRAESVDYENIDNKPVSFQPSAHTHVASDISSGTLNAARIPNLDASKITSGTIDIARLPAGALERLITVADQTARFALTTNDVQLGDVVKQADTGIMYYVVNTSKLNNADGYSEFTAGTATSVPWSGVTGKPSSYAPSSHTHTASEVTNCVDIASTQTITGQKTITSTLTIGGNNGIYFDRTQLTRGTNPSSALYYGTTRVRDSETNTVYLARGVISSAGKNTYRVAINNWDTSGGTDTSCGVELNVSADGLTKSFVPYTHNDVSLGSSAEKWASVYANAYYLGSTPFGDVVTHDAGEFADADHTHTATEISGVLDSDCIPGIDASKITSGTIDIDRLPAGYISGSGSGSSGSTDWSMITNKPSSFTPSVHTHGNITDDGKIGSSSKKPLITGSGGLITVGSFGTAAGTFCQGNDSRLSDARTPTAHTHSATDITSGTIDASCIPGIDASKITSGTISADRLPAGFVSGNASSVDWSGITNKPSTFTPSSHTHGNVTNDGKVGTTANKPLITGSGGAIVAGSFGTTANTFCAGNDSRLSDARTPLSHTHTASEISDLASSVAATDHVHGNITSDGKIGTAAKKPLITSTNGLIVAGSFGTAAGTFCQGNDSRLSDARTPTAHTHSASDITSGLATVATSGSYNDLSNKPTSMTPKSHTHGSITNDGKVGTAANKPLITTTNGAITTGSFGTTANTFCQGNDSRLSDARTPLTHTHTTDDLIGCVTLATDQDITSQKTIVDKALCFKDSDLVRGEAPSSTQYYGAIRTYDGSNNPLTQLRGTFSTAKNNIQTYTMYSSGGTDYGIWKCTVSEDGTSRAISQDVTSIAPLTNNVADLGTSSKRWKNIYANQYYLGTTAFGDIVTHNASEFINTNSTGSTISLNVGASQTTSSKIVSKNSTTDIEIFNVTRIKTITINSSGIGFPGWNTVGSTILARAATVNKTNGSYDYIAAQYGTTVDGSKLYWAALDTDGGQFFIYSSTGSGVQNGNLGADGTWVKVSGNDNNSNGFGLWRRIA